ncbi:hypothetical protein SETIT_J016900v2 [Setaria italica]|uniref:Uncharacterized protein n=1 Tax=Setaria italica TaxID=4555 RepID=A0A368PEI4_SETIT|nr:hypothetical protein SETIT_J016900v2 [Setaria italica]
MSVWPEETFARLRYLLGGLRPIETVYLRLSLGPRTVIVTAAVHRGFGRRLPCHQFTNFLDLPALGRRQPPYMVLRLAETCVFGKQSPGPGRSSFSWEYGMGYILQRRSAGMSLVEKQWLVHGAHTSALQRLVLGPRLEAFSLPLLTLKKQGHLVSLNL